MLIDFWDRVVLAFAQTSEEARMKLQGTWTAIKAERDGKALTALSDIGSPSPATASRLSLRTASASMRGLRAKAKLTRSPCRHARATSAEP